MSSTWRARDAAGPAVLHVTAAPITDPVTADATVDEAPGGRASLGSVVARLSAVNGLIVLVGLITGPLQARALGPSGRGDLAAILLPLTLGPVVVSFGLGTYLIREIARRERPGPVLGSVGVLIAGCGALSMAVAPFVAELFAGGREVVYTWVLIGFLIMPLSLFAWLVMNVATGLEAWSRLVLARLVPSVVMLVGVVVLFLTGDLTVANAAALMLVGGLLSVIPVLGVLRQVGRLSFSRRIASESVRFGFKAWLGGLGSVANVRLDQLLMTRLVTPHELGLYVVAFTVSTFFVNPVLGAMTAGMQPRFAAGDAALVARVTRTTLLGVSIASAGVALVTPVLVIVLFGSAFSDAIPVALLLILATIPLAGSSVLSTALTSGGRPGLGAASEMLTLAITVPALIVFLPEYGGRAAAITSVVAYTASFSFLALSARRHLDLRLGELLVIRRTDLVLVRDQFLSARPVRKLRRGLTRLRP